MQIVQSAYFDAGWLQGLVLASCLLVQADSEAFFLPGLLSRSSARPRPLGHAHTRHQRQLLAAARTAPTTRTRAAPPARWPQCSGPSLPRGLSCGRGPGLATPPTPSAPRGWRTRGPR